MAHSQSRTHHSGSEGGARRSRLDVLLEAHYQEIPSGAFERIFDLSGSSIRARKRELGLTGSSCRQDSFARTKELPPLPALTKAEFAVVSAYWQELRENYARNERTAKLRRFIRRFGDRLPNVLIGGMFGVSGAAVLAHRRDMGCVKSAAESSRLTREVLTADAPPRLEGLGERAEAMLGAVWRVLREEMGIKKRLDQDKVLRAYNNILPTFVLAELFGTGVSAVCARRRELKLEAPDARSVQQKFFRSARVPDLALLTPEEKHRVDVLRQDERRRRTSARSKLFETRAKALLKRLLGRKKNVKGGKRAACTKCSRKWPRTPDFFTRNRWGPDGMDRRCKVCEYRARHQTPVRKVRAPERVIQAGELDHLLEVVRENRALIPSRFLQELFHLNRNHLYRLRKQAGVKVSTAEAWHLYVSWVLADQMPEVKALTEDEHQQLSRIWEAAKEEYQDALHEDDGRMSLQEGEAQALLSGGRAVQMLACWGPYCQGRKMWPKSGTIFRRHTRCKDRDRRCHACANLEKRLRERLRRKEEG